MLENVSKFVGFSNDETNSFSFKYIAENNCICINNEILNKLQEMSLKKPKIQKERIFLGRNVYVPIRYNK